MTKNEEWCHGKLSRWISHFYFSYLGILPLYHNRNVVIQATFKISYAKLQKNGKNLLPINTFLIHPNYSSKRIRVHSCIKFNTRNKFICQFINWTNHTIPSFAFSLSVSPWLKDCYLLHHSWRQELVFQTGHREPSLTPSSQFQLVHMDFHPCPCAYLSKKVSISVSGMVL